MVNNLNDRINCETGELNPPIGMAGAGHEDSEEAATGGAAFTREFGRGFKAGRESAHKIERAEPSRGAPTEYTTAQKFWEDEDHPTELAATADTLSWEQWNAVTAFAERYADFRLERGHVVLLEALRHMKANFYDDFGDQCTECGEKVGTEASCDSCRVYAEAEAAIQQAERT